MKRTTPNPSSDSRVRRDPQARHEAERAEAALKNVREGYGGKDTEKRSGGGEPQPAPRKPPGSR